MPPASHSPTITVIDPAGAVGDAAMRAAALQGCQVRTLTSNPESATVFSDSVHAAHGDLTDEVLLGNTVAGADAVILALGERVAEPPHAGAEDPFVAEALVYAMRAAGTDRLIVTMPLDALQLTTSGTRARSAPARRHTLRERARTAASTLRADHSDHRALLAARRAYELVRLSGQRFTVLAHPRVIVAPGPAQVELMPAVIAPSASAEISAAMVAQQALRCALSSTHEGETVVVSEV